jgi:TRAP-type C4-dicarboxylate transport system permease small subunit
LELSVFGRFLHFYGLTVDFLDRFVMAACTVMLVVVVTLNGLEIVTRSFFGYSSLYSAELSLTISALMYFLGYVVLLRRDQDVRLDYFYLKLPTGLQRVIDALLALGVLTFFSVLFEASIRYVRLTSMMQHPVMPIPQSYTTAPILLAAACCLWVALYKVLVAIDRLFSPREVDAA